MKIKKEIKELFNSIPLPEADKVLPKTTLVEKQSKSYKRLTLRLAVAVLCVGAILTSVIVVLDKSPEPSPAANYSDLSSTDESIVSNADNTTISEEQSQNFGGISVNGIENPNESQNGEVDESSDIQQEPDQQEPNEEPAGQESGETPEPDGQEPDEYPGVELDTITIYGNMAVGEFAGDMYRPEGYNKNIGSALAIMMSMNKNEETKFNVLVHTYDAIDLKDHLLMFVDEVEVITVEIQGNFAGQAFYVCLTDAQIKALTDSGLKCCYIGSGLGDHKDIDWETEEGKRLYCEIWGDMYTFNQNGVSSNPDIYTQ